MVTEDVARMLEDIIRQRVKDKAWDEAERKVRRVEDLSQYKKKHVLDQENSKLSLAQVNKEELFKLDEWAKSEKKKTCVRLLDKEQEEEIPESVNPNHKHDPYAKQVPQHQKPDFNIPNLFETK